jgi:hypothetical protein
VAEFERRGLHLGDERDHAERRRQCRQPRAERACQGVGDYNKDGRSDILFQNSSGVLDIWEMNGTSVVASSSLGNPGPTWHV